MTPAEIREIRSAMQSSFILMRAELPENLLALADATEKKALEFMEIVLATQMALDLLTDVADVRLSVTRRMNEILDRPTPLRLVKDVYEGESIA